MARSKPAKTKRGGRRGRDARGPSASGPSARPRPRRWLPVTAVVLVVGAMAVLLLPGRMLRIGSSVRIPVPADLESADRQIRAYIEAHLEEVRAAPGDPQRHATLGLVYAANSYWPDARVCFENVTRLSPDEPLGHLYVAIADQELGRLDEAIAGFRAVAERVPSFAPVQDRLGLALLQSGAVDEAAAPFRRLSELAPQEWRGHAGLGEVLVRTGRMKEAAALLERAVALQPNAGAAHYQLGLAYRSLGRPDDAVRALDRGMESERFPMRDDWSVTVPDHQKGLKDQIRNANGYQRQGNSARAVEILETAIQWHPEHPDAMSSLALVHVRAGRAREARELLLKVLAIDDTRYRDHINMAAAEMSLRNPDAALTHADRAVAIAPDIAMPHQLRAQVLQATNRPAEALAALERAVACEPGNAAVRIQAGDALLRAGRAAEAQGHFRVATLKAPARAVGFRKLAEAALATGDLPAAAAALDTARALEPGDPALDTLSNRLERARGARAQDRGP